MNIQEIIQARELLYKQISPKNIGTSEQSFLIDAISSLDSIINIFNNPIKYKRNMKLCGIKVVLISDLNKIKQ